MAPALVFVEWIKIWRSGPADELMTSSMFPATKRRTIRKIAPVKVPMPTQITMIFGPSTAACGISGSIRTKYLMSEQVTTFNHVCDSVLMKKLAHN